MTSRTSTNLTALIALLALVVAGSGTALAAGIAKDAVTSKSIKNNSVKSKDLKDHSVTSVDVRDGTLESGDVRDGTLETGDVRDGTLQSGDVMDDGLTGADIAEASLGTVPNATAVGGVRITPVSLSMPSTSSGVTVLTEAGNTVSLDCQGAALRLVMSRAASGPPILLTGVLANSNVTASSLNANESVEILTLDGQFTVGMAVAGGATATLEFAAIYETNAQGANDCFYRGTITRNP